MKNYKDGKIINFKEQSGLKLSLCIPIMGQLEDTKTNWGLHVENLGDKANSPELIVINNDYHDSDTIKFLRQFVFPHFPEHKLINNPENLGVVKSMNQCIKESTGDVIAILHNDLSVFEQDWDERVLKVFENPRVGLAGFFGAQGTFTNGGRMDAVSNMIEAEYHGERFEGNRRVGHFDGLSLIGRREMFEQIGGFDEKYTFHHFYDRDIALSAHFAGWELWYIGVYCHHRSGVTANRQQYQKWIDQKMETKDFTGDKASYDASEQYFFSKWRDKLPVYIPK